MTTSQVSVLCIAIMFVFSIGFLIYLTLKVVQAQRIFMENVLKTNAEKFEILSVLNRHLTDLLAAKDPLAFQQIAVMGPSPLSDSEIVGMSDEEEAQRYLAEHGHPSIIEEPDEFDYGSTGQIGDESGGPTFDGPFTE